MTDSKDKEVIKNLQAKTEIIYKMEDKASKVLVLNIGSSSIKMGFANQKIPFEIKPFIAYKRRTQTMEEETLQEEEDINTEEFKSQYMKIETFLKNQCIINSEHRPTKGKPRGKQIIPMNSFPDFQDDREFLCGDAALTVEDCPHQYVFKKPLRYGQLNIQDDSTESLNDCLNDLEKLLCFLMKEKLQIPEKQWRTFSCIMSIPDVFIRSHIKNLIAMIFTKIGFNRMYVHLESILACLGTAISSAVVVDIGHQKINVCCVDEGIILPKTLVRKNFGMKNVSKILVKLFKNKILDPECQLSSQSECDLAQIDQIKDMGCAVREPQDNSNKVYEIKTRRNKEEISLQVNYNDALCIAANSVFFNIWNSFSREDCYHDAFNSRSILYALAPDPDDIFEQYSGGGHIYEIDDDNPMFSKELADPFIFQPIDDLVAASLLAIKDVEMRKKFLTNILVVGGGGMLPQLPDELVRRLTLKFEAQGVEEKAEIATDLILREINGAYASLLGGTVLPKLDSLRDLWIEKNKFIGCMKEELVEIQDEGILDKKLFTRKEESQEWGIRYLKEKLPFLW